jgi:hypothetical protein
MRDSKELFFERPITRTGGGVVMAVGTASASGGDDETGDGDTASGALQPLQSRRQKKGSHFGSLFLSVAVSYAPFLIGTTSPRRTGDVV